MASLSEVITRLTNIDKAIEDALNNEVADVVKEAIVNTARTNVYDAYPNPRYLDRRDGAGGILDKESIAIEVRNETLTAKDTSPGVRGDKGWQQRLGGAVPSGRLAEAIASGDDRYNMGRAGPRPFHEDAERRVISDGSAADALKRGLERQGY